MTICLAVREERSFKERRSETLKKFTSDFHSSTKAVFHFAFCSKLLLNIASQPCFGKGVLNIMTWQFD